MECRWLLRAAAPAPNADHGCGQGIGPVLVGNQTARGADGWQIQCHPVSLELPCVSFGKMAFDALPPIFLMLTRSVPHQVDASQLAEPGMTQGRALTRPWSQPKRCSARNYPAPGRLSKALPPIQARTPSAATGTITT